MMLSGSLSDPVVVKICFPNEQAETIDNEVFYYDLDLIKFIISIFYRKNEVYGKDTDFNFHRTLSMYFSLLF